jgi:hypothetical protein
MTDNSHLTEERLASAVSAFVDLLSAGTAPDVEQYLEQYSDLAEVLRPLLKTAVQFAGAAAECRPIGNDEASYDAVQKKVAAAAERRALRAAMEAGTAKVPVTQRSDVLLLLLRAVGDVFGRTRLVKLLFLTGKETNATRVVPDFFRHFAYNYGPFDDEIFRDVEALAQHGLVDARAPLDLIPGKRHVDAVYRLTPKGKKYAEALARAEASAPGLVGELKVLALKYGRLSLDDLVRHVYETYPEYTTESLIRDEVLGKGHPPKKK